MVGITRNYRNTTQCNVELSLKCEIDLDILRGQIIQLSRMKYCYIFQSFTADSLRLSACCWVMLPCNAPTAGARPGLHSHNSVLVSLCLGSDIETPLLLLWCNYQFYIQRGQSLFSVCQTITSGCRVLETCHFYIHIRSVYGDQFTMATIPRAVVLENHVITSDFQCLIVPTFRVKTMVITFN